MSENEAKKYSALQQTLFLDVLFNRRTRPILLYTFLMVAIEAVLYHWLEGWSWADSFYFVVVTLTTIGYGDLVPTSPLTKLITIFYGLNGVILLLVMFDAVRTQRRWYMGGGSEGEVSQEGKPTL